MGTGLSVYRVKTNRFENYQYDMNVVNSIPTNRISGSTVLPNNKIWLSTLGAGLIQCDEVDGKIVFKRINPNGINSNMIYCITTDKKGKTWLLTQTNVMALDDQGNILYKQLQSIVKPI